MMGEERVGREGQRGRRVRGRRNQGYQTPARGASAVCAFGHVCLFLRVGGVGGEIPERGAAVRTCHQCSQGGTSVGGAFQTANNSCTGEPRGSPPFWEQWEAGAAARARHSVSGSQARCALVHGTTLQASHSATATVPRLLWHRVTQGMLTGGSSCVGLSPSRE